MNNRPPNQKLPPKPPLRISKEDYSIELGDLKPFVGIIVFCLVVFLITFITLTYTNSLEAHLLALALIAGVIYFVFLHIPNTKWGKERKAAKEQLEREPPIVPPVYIKDLPIEEQERIKLKGMQRNAFYNLLAKGQCCYRGIFTGSSRELTDLVDGDFFYKELVARNYEELILSKTHSFMCYYQGNWVEGYIGIDSLMNDFILNQFYDKELESVLKKLIGFRYPCEFDSVFTDYSAECRKQFPEHKDLFAQISAVVSEMRYSHILPFRQNLTKASNEKILELATNLSECNETPFADSIKEEFKERLQLLREIEEAKKIKFKIQSQFKADLEDMALMLKGNKDE